MFALKWKERKKKSKIYLTGVDGGGGKWRRWLAHPGRGGGGGRRGEEDTRRRRDPKWLQCASPRPDLSNLYGSISRGGYHPPLLIIFDLFQKHNLIPKNSKIDQNCENLTILLL